MRLPAPISGPRAHLPGLPAARTEMAWDRTALGLIGHGALLVIRHPGDAGVTRVAAAACSLALALTAAVLGRRRAREIAHSEATRRAPAPRTALLILTAGVLALAMLDLVAIGRS